MKFTEEYKRLMEDCGGMAPDGGSTPGGAMSDADYVDSSVNTPSAANAIYVIVKTDSGETKEFKKKEDLDAFLADNPGWKKKGK
ncbi:unnamed protein product [marine sediment metagenome]|uniref:Uncharacterized protein n=1 Tax=marine sediment metagenome TaxID=412755 RepID=X0SIG0_9ZZZZ